MKGKYTIRFTHGSAHLRSYAVLNPSGIEIAWDCTWRSARKIADALNAQQVKP